MTVARAQTPDPPGHRFDGLRIATIQFVPTLQPLEGQELHRILALKIGSPFQMADVRKSIEALFATGRYADLQVEADPLGTDQVVVRFVTKHSLFIGRVGIEGNVSDAPNPGQLANSTRLELGAAYHKDKLAVAENGLKQLLESNGLFRHTITPLFTYDERYQQVHLTFDIRAEKRARFEAPLFEGELQISKEKLIRSTHWQKFLLRSWKQITQRNVLQGLNGIRSRYNTEDRMEAKVTLKSLDYNPDTNRAKPNIEIHAGPRVSVHIIGAKLSKSKLKQYIPIYEEHTVDRDLLVEGSRNLRDYYQSQGYFDVEVEFKEQRVTGDKADIDYIVNTGKRHRLVSIEIKGNKYFKADVIRERIFLTPSSRLQFRHGRYSESFVRRDKETIAGLYQSNGFREVAVNARSIDDYNGKTGDLVVVIEITEGPQWFIRSLDIQGPAQLKIGNLIPSLSSQQGQPYGEFNIAVDRNAILAYYFVHGFPNATFEWSSKPDPQTHQMDLKFVIHEGDQQFVREVLVGGLKTTRPSLVYRNLEMNPGDPLSPTNMTDTQRRLYDLGIFASVETAIQNPDGNTPNKYVLYQMEEARRYSVTFGFGAEIAKLGGCGSNCLQAPTGQTGFSPRASFDVTRLNIFGLGHSLGLRTRISTLKKRGLLTYSAPRFRNNDRLNISFNALYDDSREVNTFRARRQEGSAQLQQKISKSTTLFHRLTYRRVQVSELNVTPYLFPFLLQPVRLGLFSENLVQDRRDDPVEPHKGVYNSGDITIAEKVLGSQRNFFRFLGRNSTYHPLSKKLTLARNTTFGSIWAFRTDKYVCAESVTCPAYLSAIQAIPLSERFFSGGTVSHRGFPQNQAGPRDTVTGLPLGGTAMLFNQTELRFPLIGDNIAGVVFHDMGNVYSSLSNLSFKVKQHDLTDFDYMVHAAGFGIRYRTPIGPVRLDIAYSINPPRFTGFSGTASELLNSGLNPCATTKKCGPQSVGHFQFFFSIGQAF